MCNASDKVWKICLQWTKTAYWEDFFQSDSHW